jgi:hypothetical protein
MVPTTPIRKAVCPFFFGVIALFPLMVFSQDTASCSWTFDGDIRYRFEKWHNMNTLSYGDDPVIGEPGDQILLQRIVAGSTFRFRKNFCISFHMQDSRAFGWSLAHQVNPDAFLKHPDDNPEQGYRMNPQEEFFEIYDASIRMDNILGLFTVVAGRQKIAFGDYRVFGPGKWGNTGRWTWDAVLLELDRPSWAIRTWIGGTKIHDPVRTHLPFTQTEYNGGGVHLGLKPGPFPRADLYFAHKRQGSASYIRDQRISRNWVGFRIFQPENSSFQYELSFTREMGSEEGTGINASGLFLMTGYHAAGIPWNPALSLRYSAASGNDPETAENEMYDPVYGSGDRYYGWMNIVRWSNLNDREVMLEMNPGKNLSIEARYNQFRIREPGNQKVNGNLILPPGENHLGDEFDLITRYDLNDKWQFTTVFGYFWLKEGRTPEQEDPGNALLASIQVLYRFKVNITSTEQIN